MTDEFKLPGSSFQELSKIIQGYATLGKAASLSDVSKVIGGMDPTTISRNTGFLVATGILEPGKNKSATSLGVSLGNALTHDQHEEIGRLFGEVIRGSEFLRSVISAIRIRKGMDENALRSHIAYSAGAKKGNSTTTGAGTVIEVLENGGTIISEDGKFVVAPVDSMSSQVDAETSKQKSVPEQERQYRPENGSSKVSVAPRFDTPLASSGGLEIKINIDVSCTADELDTLGQKLRQVLVDLKENDDLEDAVQSSDNDNAAE